MQRIPAHEWIAKCDAAREAKLGEVAVVMTVAEPPQFRDYPMGKKRCVCCDRESKKSLPLDGRNYYCPNIVCQAARLRRVRGLQAGVLV